MSGTMQALILRDIETGPRLETVAFEDPREGEVVVRLEASGICGSDLHLLHGRSNVEFLPALMGHEGAGRVVEVGPSVDGVAVGDRVAVAMSAPCGQCPPCARGQAHLCSAPSRGNRISGRMLDGSSRVFVDDDPVFPFVGCGTVAEYTVVPAAQLVPVPDALPIEAAAVACCGVVTGLGAVFNIAQVEPGSTALVIGCGGVGLSMIQGCRIAGARRIIAIDTVPARLEVALSIGATDIVDATKESATDAVRRIFPEGVDSAFEAVGQVALVNEAFSLVRPGGVCVAGASYPAGSTYTLQPQDVFWGRRLLGSVAGNSVPKHDLVRAMNLAGSGQLNLDILTQQQWPLAQVHDAIAASESGSAARAVITLTS